MKTLRQWACIALGLAAACWIHSALAQNSSWSGLGTNGLWADPNNWTPVGVPRSVAQGLDPTTGGNVSLDPANGVSVITITNGEVENPGIQTTVTRPPYNTIFGPEFGASLHIYGTLNFDWVIAPVQNDPTPSNRSMINMYGNSSMSTSGAGFGLGDEWWWLGGPHVTMNLFDNAQASILGGAGLWLGGHLNIYDSATLTVGSGGYVNMDTGGALSDGTRSIVLGGGALVLPTGWTNAGTAGQNSGTVYDWIGRGILRAYGKAMDTNDLVITDDGTNTTVTTVPLGGALERIYFQPLVRSGMVAGTFQQATLVGDYPAVSGVLLSSSEPGLNPAVTGRPTYTSSNPEVITVDTNGIVTAVNPGSATLTATLGPLTSTNSLEVTVTPITATLIHRYSFNETSGITAADSVPGNSPTWDAYLMNDAVFGGGQVHLNETSGYGYVLLPPAIASGLDDLTVEAWASFAASLSNGATLFAFGNTSDTNGSDYVFFQPHTVAGTAAASFGQGTPGNSAARNAVISTNLDGQANMHIVVVFRPSAGYESVYTNGVQAATVSLFNNLIDPVAFQGPTYTNASILAYTLGTDPLNYIGLSLYAADGSLNASVDEFRVYNGPLSAGQILADHALGPDQLIGTSTNVSLTATSAGGEIILTWPATSSLVNVMSSPTLGPGAHWSAVIGNLSVSAGKYQMTVPATDSARFFRLQE